MRFKSMASIIAVVVLAAAHAQAATSAIRIAVPGPGTGAYFPIEYIAAIGADKAEGVEIRLSFVPGGGVAIDQLLSNTVDFAVIGLPAAMSARLKDKRIVAIAPVDDLPLYALMVRSGLRSKVRRVSDLKGMTIGVHSNSVASKTNSHQLIELLLEEGGVNRNQVRYVAVGQRWETESSMLKSGEADAVMGDEPFASRMEDEGTAFALVHLGRPEDTKNIPGAAFLRAAVVARQDVLDADPELAARMVRIVKRTLAALAKSSPEQIADSAGISDPVARKYMVRTLSRFPRQYSVDGVFSTRQLQETELFFHRSQSHNPAAQALRIEDMVVDRWSGRKD